MNTPAFVGLGNFRQILDDPRLRPALTVTFVYTFVSVPLSLAAALGTLMLPQHVLLVPQYIIFHMVQFMRTLPNELTDAARLAPAIDTSK